MKCWTLAFARVTASLRLRRRNVIPAKAGIQEGMQDFNLKPLPFIHHSYESMSLEMTMRCTSEGPSPIRRVRSSRYQRSSGISLARPMPP